MKNENASKRIGILSPSEIAYRRFLPALKNVAGATLIGVGMNTPDERYGSNLPDTSEIAFMLENEKEKASKMISEYGGNLFSSYEEIISSPDIDAIYIPLPPALHYKWSREVLKHGKHVLVEKPSTTSYKETNDLVEIAENSGLGLHENYMFIFHNQLRAIDSIVKSGEIGFSSGCAFM